MKINEKRVARPPKAAKLEIHFEGNLICCKWAKNILLHGAWRSCTVCPSASSVCRHVFVADEDAMLWIAQLRGGKHRSLLITPVTAFSFYMTALQHSLHVWIQLRDVEENLSKVTCKEQSLALFTSGVCIFSLLRAHQLFVHNKDSGGWICTGSRVIWSLFTLCVCSNRWSQPNLYVACSAQWFQFVWRTF